MDQSEGIVNLVGAAKMVGVGETAIRYWILTGLLPAKRNGWRWEIRKEDVVNANEKALANSRGGKRGRRGSLRPESNDTATNY